MLLSIARLLRNAGPCRSSTGEPASHAGARAHLPRIIWQYMISFKGASSGEVVGQRIWQMHSRRMTQQQRSHRFRKIHKSVFGRDREMCCCNWSLGPPVDDGIRFGSLHVHACKPVGRPSPARSTEASPQTHNLPRWKSRSPFRTADLSRQASRLGGDFAATKQGTRTARRARMDAHAPRIAATAP